VKRRPSRKISPSTARRILREGKARGRKLSRAQRGLFGAALQNAPAGKPKYETGDGRTFPTLEAASKHAGAVFQKKGVVLAVEQRNPPESETIGLAALLAHLGGVRRGLAALVGADNLSAPALQVRSNLAAVETIARTLLNQVRRGIHTNLPLAIVGNPPVPMKGADGARITYDGVLGRATELRYRHAQNGKLWKHPFDTAATIHTAVRGGRKILVIAGPRDLWANFEV
jgi:hypothetical protein